MHLLNKLFLGLSLLFLPLFIAAQQIISRASHRVEYRIPYHKAGGREYETGNTILREMAKDVLREPWRVNIRVSCELGLFVAKADGGDQLFITLKHAVIAGDTVYRHFPVAGVLFPSHISLKLRWANRADTSGYTEETLAGKPVPGNDSLAAILPVVSYNPRVDTLIVREVEFFYDSLAVQRFLERIELIHDYYASVTLLDSLNEFTGNLDLDNAKMLPVNYFRVEELCRVIGRIDARDFPGRLLRDGFDPSGLVAKYAQIYKHSRSLVFNFMDALHRTGKIPWDGDADRLASYFTSRIFSYVSRSFLMDEQQGRIYTDCLDHFFDQPSFPPGENVAGSLLARMFPDAVQDTTARYISERIYASYRSTALELIDQNQHAAAFSLMENGRRFIAGNPFLKGVAADKSIQSQAAEGIFNSYIGIASSCIGAHKFDMADLYLAKADQYATTHAGYIISDSSYKAVFSELFFLRNADCDKLLGQQDYAAALDCYRQFEKAYPARDLALVRAQLDEKKSLAMTGMSRQSALLAGDALKHKDADTALVYFDQAVTLRQESKSHEPADPGLDSLAPIMARIRYGQIFKGGTQAFGKRQFTLAVTLLKEAKSIAGAFGIDRNREFDSLYRLAMKNWLIVQLSASQKKIWASQFDSAQAALRRTEVAGFDFGLLNEPDFLKATDNYKSKIREQQCRNVQDSIELRMIRADRSIALENYVNTMVYLQQALAIAHSQPECGIAEKPIKDSLERYRQAAAYQQKLAEARSLVSAGKYDEAVRELDENQQAFQVNRLSRFGLDKDEIVVFIRERNNPYLTEKAVTYFAGLNNYKDAFAYLLLAHEQGLPASTDASLQKKLGRELAHADYLKNPNDHAMENAAKYGPDDRWLGLLHESYMKEWNRLVKAAPEGTQ